jgi:hypothetical protein
LGKLLSPTSRTIIRLGHHKTSMGTAISTEHRGWPKGVRRTRDMKSRAQCNRFLMAARTSAMLAFALFVFIGTALSQTGSPADGPWSGSANCQITVHGPGYSHRETHTWILAGGSPTIRGVWREHCCPGKFKSCASARSGLGQCHHQRQDSSSGQSDFARLAGGTIPFIRRYSTIWP